MLEKGLKHISRTVVQPDNFALTMGSGDLPVLATPALVALMENAAMLAVAAELPEGATTRDSADVIGEGTHIRYIVDRAKFLLKLKG